MSKKYKMISDMSRLKTVKRLINDALDYLNHDFSDVFVASFADRAIDSLINTEGAIDGAIRSEEGGDK